MGENTAKLGKAIQSARQKASITQQELCQKAQLSYSTLAKIERGAIKTPSVFTVFRIAAVLGISVDELLANVVETQEEKPKRTSKNGTSFLYVDINCLVRYFQAAFTHITADTGITSDVIEAAFWHYIDDVCRGDISLSEFDQKLAEQIGVSSIDWNEYYLQAVEQVQEMHELLTWASQHYRVGLLSNVMPGQIQSMIDRGLLPNIAYDSIIDSSEVKSIKPDAEMYRAAEQRAGVPASEILFIDDSRTNIMAAERRGWKVMLFDDFDVQESANKIRLALEW